MLLTQDIKVTAETAGRTKGRILLKACCDVCKRLVAVLSWLHLVTFVKLNIDAAHAARRTTIGCRLMCSGKEPSCADIEIFCRDSGSGLRVFLFNRVLSQDLHVSHDLVEA